MKAIILHESKGRIRFRIGQKKMTLQEADVLENWFQKKSWITQVTVHERTGCVILQYSGSRKEVLAAIREFNLQEAQSQITLPLHSSRELNRKFQEKLVGKVVLKAASMLFLPKPLQIARIVWHIVAHGIASTVNEERVLIGSAHFIFEDEGVTVPLNEQERFDRLPEEYSHLYLAIGRELAAVICISDPLRREAKEVLTALRALGIQKTVMLTGDSYRTASTVANRLGVDAFCAEVLPADKAKFVADLRQKGHIVLMVGDGINDSPALSEADAGIAISDGAAIAREIADITIAADSLWELVKLRRIAMALMERIHSNYRFVIGFNGTLIGLGLAGILPPAASAALHNLSTLGVSLRSMSALPEPKQDNDRCI